MYLAGGLWLDKVWPLSSGLPIALVITLHRCTCPNLCRPREVKVGPYKDCEDYGILGNDELTNVLIL